MLQTIKVIIASVAFIYIIYLGVMLILAQGNETEITKQKKQLYYTFIAFVFINIPGKIYELF